MHTHALISAPGMTRYFAFTAALLMAVHASAAEFRSFGQIEAFWLQGTERSISDLSGLAMCNGRLLTVSDKISGTIFEILFDGADARVVPALRIPTLPAISADYEFPDNLRLDADQLRNPHRMDWEGIACTADAIYLLSEEFNAILKIENGRSEWLPTNWYPPLSKQGYLTRFNAYGEGLAADSASHFYVALEREPRGLLDITLTATQPRYAVSPLPNEGVLDFHGRTEDVAGLAEHHDRLFFLERNAAAVCERSRGSWQPKSCFSFEKIEDDPEYQYRDRKYGMAEGLVVSDDWTYIVYDNNRTARVKDANDRRALLLKIPTPPAWQ